MLAYSSISHLGVCVLGLFALKSRQRIELGGLLQRAGLALSVADSDRLAVRYSDPFALMNEILGRPPWAPSVFGCPAPDSGTAEILKAIPTSRNTNPKTSRRSYPAPSARAAAALAGKLVAPAKP